MRRLLPLALLAPLSGVMPAKADVVLPNLYARTYCDLRSVGVGIDDAVRAAMRDSLISGTATKVYWNGTYRDVDVIQATIAVTRLCPQYMTN